MPSDAGVPTRNSPAPWAIRGSHRRAGDLASGRLTRGCRPSAKPTLGDSGTEPACRATSRRQSRVGVTRPGSRSARGVETNPHRGIGSRELWELRTRRAVGCWAASCRGRACHIAPSRHPFPVAGRASVEMARRCRRGIVRVVRVEAARVRCPPGYEVPPRGTPLKNGDRSDRPRQDQPRDQTLPCPLRRPRPLPAP